MAISKNIMHDDLQLSYWRMLSSMNCHGSYTDSQTGIFVEQEKLLVVTVGGYISREYRDSDPQNPSVVVQFEFRGDDYKDITVQPDIYPVLLDLPFFAGGVSI